MSADQQDRQEPAGREGRQQRLATALRDNLKRRKAQARSRMEDTAPPSPPRRDDGKPSG